MTYLEFEQLWETNLKQEVTGLEHLRKKARNAIFIGVIIGALALIISEYFLLKAFPTSDTSIGAIISFFLGISIAIQLWPKDYKKFYKEKIIQTILKKTANDWKYDMPVSSLGNKPDLTRFRFFKSFIPSFSSPVRLLFENSGLYYSNITTFTWDDSFVSQKNPALRAMEISAGKKSGKSTITIFQGLLFSFDIKNQFRGETYIRTENESKLSFPCGTSNSRTLFSSKLVSTKLEWNDFENLLDVKTTDEIEAREILDPYFMENLYDWWKNHKKNVRISFKDTSMYMAVPYTGNLFEPNPFVGIEKHKKIIWESLDAFLFAEKLLTHIENKYHVYAR